MQNAKMRILILLMLIFTALPTFAQRRSILEQAQRDAQSFATFADLAVAAGLDEVLNGDGPYTVFMPTNVAINNMLTATGITAEDLTANTELLSTILKFHILEGQYTAADITAAYGGQADGVLELTTLGGEQLTVQVDPAGAIIVGGMGNQVFLPDTSVGNGIIHAIDGVLLPPSLRDDRGRATFRDREYISELLSGAPDFSSFVGALTENALIDTLTTDDDYTVFAPTNDAILRSQSAMAEDPSAVLQMHIVPGRWTVQALSNKLAVERRNIGTLETLGGAVISYQLTADGTIILNGQGISTFTSDVVVDNGVIHYISDIMLPQREETVGEFVRNSTDYTILETILNSTDMMASLDGEGPFTVLAPTDDAFTRLAERLNITVDDLLANPELLTTIVQFHVIEGTFMADDLIAAYSGQDDNVLEVATLGGEELTLQADEEGTIILNKQGIDVFLPDIIVSNGVIHGIPGVLIPPSLRDENGRPTFGSFRSIIDVLNRDAASFSRLVELLQANGLADTLAGTTQYTLLAPTNGALLAAESNMTGSEAAILQFHVIPGRYTAKNLADLYALEDDGILELETLGGDELWLQVQPDGTIVLNAQGITVTVKDLGASNGVVHAIDGVLQP